MGAEDFCSNLFYIYEIRVFGPPVGIVMVALGALYWIMSLIIIYFIKRQEFYAKQGNDEAVQSVIFPVFVNVLWMNALVNVYVGAIAMIFTFHPYDTDDRVVSWVFSCMWALQHAVVEGVALLLMQKGLGYRAARRVLKKALAWGFVTFVFQVLMYRLENFGSAVFNFTWQGSLAIFYATLYFAPQKRLFRRPAAYLYARAWLSFRVIEILASALYYVPGFKAEANCFFVFGTLFPFAVLEPLLLYFTLLQDSRWWQGMDIYVGRMRQSSGNIRSPLQGIDINLGSAQSLAASLDYIGNLFQGSTQNSGRAGSAMEKRKSKGNVKLLNFACISLDHTKLLGSGSFSKVYQGSYRQQQCAIKLIFTIDLTTEVIQRIAAEAQILSSIRHPHVVDILGVSVLPPSVCILLELCTFGSLGDVLKGAAKPPIGSLRLPDSIKIAPAVEKAILTYLHGSSDNSIENLNLPATQQMARDSLCLSWTDRLYLAVGCARGLAALHSYSPHFCHRDIKSFNFLVDQQLNAKISDLELGLADEIQASVEGSSGMYSSDQLSVSTSSAKLSNWRNSSMGSGSHNLNSYNSSVGRHASNNSNRTISQDMPTIPEEGTRNSEMARVNRTESYTLKNDVLANWLAPEVIQHGPSAYHQASDVYSFALVLWEILTGSQPFDDTKNQTTICKAVIQGIRPDIPIAFVEESEYKSIFSPYIKLFSQGWSQRARDRPQIHTILEQLEQMWRDCCHLNLFSTDTMPSDQDLLANPVQGSQAPLTMSSTQLSSSNNRSQISMIRQEMSGSSSAPSFSIKNVFRSIFGSTQTQNYFNPQIPYELPRNRIEIVTTALRKESAALEKLERTGGAWILVHPSPPHIVLWVSVSWTSQMGLSMHEVVGKSLRSISLFSKNTSVESQGKNVKRNKNLTSWFSGSAEQKKDLIQQKQANEFCDSLYSHHHFFQQNKKLSVDSQPGLTHSGGHEVLTLYETVPSHPNPLHSVASQREKKKKSRGLTQRFSNRLSFRMSTGGPGAAGSVKQESLYSLHVFPIYRRTPTAEHKNEKNTRSFSPRGQAGTEVPPGGSSSLMNGSFRTLWPFRRNSSQPGAVSNNTSRNTSKDSTVDRENTKEKEKDIKSTLSPLPLDQTINNNNSSDIYNEEQPTAEHDPHEKGPDDPPTPLGTGEGTESNLSDTIGAIVENQNPAIDQTTEERKTDHHHHHQQYQQNDNSDCHPDHPAEVAMLSILFCRLKHVDDVHNKNLTIGDALSKVALPSRLRFTSRAAKYSGDHSASVLSSAASDSSRSYGHSRSNGRKSNISDSLLTAVKMGAQDMDSDVDVDSEVEGSQGQLGSGSARLDSADSGVGDSFNLSFGASELRESGEERLSVEVENPMVADNV